MGSAGKSVRHKSEIYSCQETGCILRLKTQTEAKILMDTDKDRLEVDYESIYGRVRRKWVGTVTSTSAQGADGSSPSRASGARRPL